MEQMTMQFNAARVLKASGQHLALQKSGDAWVADAIDALRKYLAAMERGSVSPPEFTFEGFRLFAEATGVSLPASINAWGGLPRAAMRAGLCVPTGRVVSACRAESHGRLIRTWRPA